MKSTFSRLFVSLSLILLAAMVVSGASFQWLYSRYLTNQTFASLQNDAKVISSLCHANLNDRSFSNEDFVMALSVAVSVSGSDVLVCDNEGNILMCADSTDCGHIGKRLERSYRDRAFASGGFTDTDVIDDLYPEERYMAAVAIRDNQNSPRAIVLVSTPVDDTLVTMRRVSRSFLLVTALVIAISVVVMTYLVRRQSTPLRDMARVASDFGHGNFRARVSTKGRNSREVEELAEAFNNMAASLEKGEYRRQEFVANVSHELKTPMTTISGYVDGILDGTIPPEKSEHYLLLVSQETKRLNRLVRSMLDISRLQDQGGMPEDQKSRFDLSEMAGQVLISFEQKINAKKIDVQVEMPEHSVFTRANPDAINQVIYNLVDNGVKFCPEGGSLGITIREDHSKVYLSVFNSGEDIPKEELPLIFDRFHKIDKSRSRNRDSWGLGLYIVKTIINSHGENITATSCGGKTEFTFTLPLVR